LLLLTVRLFDEAPEVKGYFVGARVIGQGEHEIKMYWSASERQLTLNAQPIRRLADYFGAVRAVVFCIADGVLPSNDGRGYVVRKLIRRCAYMNPSKDPKPFLYKIVSSVADAMREPYPEILERRDNIAQIIKAEEEKYIKNILEGGNERLTEEIAQHKKKEEQNATKLEFPAQTVADLFMTYGIPIEYTLGELKIVHTSTNSSLAFEIVKSEQDKTRNSSKFVMVGNIFVEGSVALKNSKFVGYDLDTCEAKVIQIIKDGKEVNEAQVGENINVVLDKTPFYGESGGQVGDRGVIAGKGTDLKLVVTDTKKQDGSIVHLGHVLGKNIKVDTLVVASVDIENRLAIKRAHTATHILQSVLRKALGPYVQQAGSLVEPDSFRFDFTHFKDISQEEMDAVQELLNDYVLRNDKLIAQQMPKSEAQKTGAIALFGEKYEDMVRIVSIGDYSKEFCGGTHLDYTGKIGLILITSESSVGSSLRRIEALTGKLAYQEVFSKLGALDEISKILKVGSSDIFSALEMKQARLKALEKAKTKRDAEDLEEQLKKTIEKKKVVGGIIFVEEYLEDRDPSLLRNTIDFLKRAFPENGVFVVSSVFDNNAYFACGVTPDLVKRGISADELIKKALPLVGGSGGGRKDFAQGGTKEIDKIDLVAKEVEKLVEEIL
ncbi:MAG: alanine--tRNA ligase-related protein, partial [Candidatus Omnitrophota bacterium]